MISVVAMLLGGDERALRVARKLNHAVVWFAPFELRRLCRGIEDEVAYIRRFLRRVA